MDLKQLTDVLNYSPYLNDGHFHYLCYTSVNKLNKLEKNIDWGGGALG